MAHKIIIGFGTTSACAENTGFVDAHPPGHGNYLRVRGEYFGRWRFALRLVELPPRARRIPQPSYQPAKPQGTTSACAENTAALLPTSETPGNYLRVRGEYYSRASQAGLIMELPPRARRIRKGGVRVAATNGTTSACAENTTG